jgi:hypothetical protein
MLSQKMIVKITKKIIEVIAFIALASIMVNKCFFGNWLCANDEYRELILDGIIIKKEKRKIVKYRTPTFIVIQMKTLEDTIAISNYGGDATYECGVGDSVRKKAGSLFFRFKNKNGGDWVEESWECVPFFE